VPVECLDDTAPVVSDDSVTFRFADPDRDLTGVRLYQEVRVPGDLLDFAASARTAANSRSSTP
jgi:hypothetical protein